MITLTGQSLSLKQMKEVLYDNQKVSASETSLEAARKSREAVEIIVSESKVVYGITTGFGKFSDVLINKIMFKICSLI
ncbi:histidine ammonia-lyase [Neobacillus ginsengisoli]|uniref:Histidine ammonia-lyase n=1 Tax=Neobacillus ginsengisoli TaxID=904295 RepID=A0ABT9Y2A7_9BACI|nr:histidine ammonia-lyase [Neobacillus ginsengisoli]